MRVHWGNAALLQNLPTKFRDDSRLLYLLFSSIRTTSLRSCLRLRLFRLLFGRITVVIDRL